MRVEPDEEFIIALDRELQIFNYFIERVMEKISATNELPIPPGKLALKAALYASLEIAPWAATFCLHPAFPVPRPAPSLTGPPEAHTTLDLCQTASLRGLW